MLRNLYIDIDRTKCAVLSPRVCRTLYECIDETINLFLRLIESSAAEEMMNMRNLQTQLGDLIETARDSHISRSSETQEFLVSTSHAVIFSDEKFPLCRSASTSQKLQVIQLFQREPILHIRYG